jgi:hypothetical protein
VDAILLLEQNLKTSQQQRCLLETRLSNDAALGYDIVEMSLEIQELREDCTRMSETIRKKRAALGVGQRTALRRIQDHEFLQLRVNALALKTRIRDRLRQRKFEREPLERSYRHIRNGKFSESPLQLYQTDNLKGGKLASNAEYALKRREPGILKLSKMYNDLCKQMRSSVQQDKAIRKTILPQPIDLKNLFELDIDDDIWQDTGLVDDDDDSAIPLWLSDTGVREGVKHMLILDRCLEKELRLRKERTSLQQWMLAEWDTLKAAHDSTGVLRKAK